MALKKVNYIKNETVITAENLNNIQDNIIANTNNITSTNTTIDQMDSRLQDVEANSSSLSSSVSTVQKSISNLQTSVASKVRFVEIVTLAASAWSNLNAVIKTANTLLESDTPHIILNTVSTATKEAYGKIDYAETFTDTDGTVKIKFVCLEKTPDIDLSLQIEVIR